MSAFRELGYGVMLFMSAMGGMAVAILSIPSRPWWPSPTHTPQPFSGVPVCEAVTGAIIGAGAWMAYKFAVLEKPRN
jgi:hypothetical protein